MEIGYRPDQSTRRPRAAERDAATEALREAFAAGRLTLEEFRDRVGAVLAAESLREVEQATDGVLTRPLIGDARPVSTVVAVLGSRARTGPWRLPDRLRVFGVLGDVHLDLGSAAYAEEIVEISAWSLLGELDLEVPDGVEVELDGFQLFGTRRLRLAPVRPVPGTPRIRVRARAAFSDISVRSPGGEALAADRFRPRGGAGRRRLIFAAMVFLLVLAYLIWPKGGGDTGPVAAPVVAATPTAPPTTPAERLTAPDVVGSRLADAQRALADAGFAKVDAVDASGFKRLVLNPQNWIVKAQSPAAGAPAPPTGAITLKVVKPSDHAASGGGRVTRGVLPDVVCMDLQGAEARLRQAGFTNVRSTDGSGQGRIQIIYRNWIVTAESPAAGHRRAEGTRVVLTTVKYGEPTGSSGCRD
ncbi:MAG TPA: PASTA domain-containing protein [Streptosporangiaceae bacterium]